MSTSDWARDVIFTNTQIHLGIADRVKILVFGKLNVNISTSTEHLPGRCESATHAYTPRIRWPWQKEDGYEVSLEELEKHG